ncbi:hypothetical protein L6164_015921 [Bauhinia variegata]|uniref:Uncharacterized protein n=1 Tax=Bauhinia variegata TaxID=167791 RepID=A0ACB9NMX1_BAUVA|nr:hypothetical protein L6164_015921 [Bauhinia variegata]
MAPTEYQFSCSGSPPRPSHTLSHVSKRRLSPMNSNYSNNSTGRRPQYSRESETKACGQRIVNVKSCGCGDIRVRPTSDNHTSPMSRRAKVTVTGSVLNDDAEEEYRVDEAAEKFIEKFYRELRLQKWLDNYC